MKDLPADDYSIYLKHWYDFLQTNETSYMVMMSCETDNGYEEVRDGCDSSRTDVWYDTSCGESVGGETTSNDYEYVLLKMFTDQSVLFSACGSTFGTNILVFDWS